MKLRICLAVFATILFMFTVANALTPVDDIAPYRYFLHNGADSLAIPVMVNRPLTNLEEVTDLFYLIHGQGRFAYSYYELFQAAEQLGVSGQTLMVVPQFIFPIDLAWHHLPNNVLFWGQDWLYGGSSLSWGIHPFFQRPFEIDYSFTVINTMIEDAMSRLPNLERITIGGFSAGATMGLNLTALPFEFNNLEDIEVRYVLGALGIPAYLNGERPVPGTVDEFYLPDSSSCPNYNNMPWGLNDIEDYVPVTAEEARQGLARASVSFMVCELDTLPTDALCESALQGRNRVLIAEAYYNHLRNHMPEAHHQIETVHNVGHNPVAYLQHPTVILKYLGHLLTADQRAILERQAERMQHE